MQPRKPAVRPTIRPLLIGAIAVLVAGCSTLAPRASTGDAPTGEPIPSVAQTPEPTEEPTPAPTQTPTPTAEAEADVVVTATALLVPPDNDFGLLGYQIVATVENHGTSWAKLLPFDSDWTALNGSGGVTSTGQMGQAYPQYLEPGGTAYLVTYDVKEGIEPTELASVEIEPEFKTVAGPEVTFELENTQVRYDGSYGLGATGFVTSSDARDLVEVGVICLDVNGAVLGVANAQIMSGLQAGEREAFETTGPPSQVQPNSCASTIIQATPHDFEF